jgi:hypothetical protein
MLLACATQDARAQQPARLPAVVVNAIPDPPGPRKIAGIVRDTSALPIDSVEVSIVSLQLRTFSTAAGNFRFEDVKPGTYEVRARKIGYAPQIRTMVVDTAGGTGAFMLLPLPHVLRPVVTTVARGGLSGVVGDTAFNALVGAEVRVMGHEGYARTDSTGSFYIPTRAGSYMVSVKQPGFDYRLVSVIIPPDSGERIRVNLAPMMKQPTLRQVHNVDDFATRLAWHEHKNSRIYTHAELEKMRIEWIYDAVKIGFHEMHQGGNGWIDADCAVIVNGGPEIRELAGLTVDDVESVEIYDMTAAPVSTAANGRPARRIPGAPMHRSPLAIDPVPLTNTDIAGWANRTKACTLVYVWLR